MLEGSQIESVIIGPHTYFKVQSKLQRASQFRDRRARALQNLSGRHCQTTWGAGNVLRHWVASWSRRMYVPINLFLHKILPGTSGLWYVRAYVCRRHSQRKNNHIVGLVHKKTNVSDVPRSLQSWVSTIQTVVLTADVFQLFIKCVFQAQNWPL